MRSVTRTYFPKLKLQEILNRPGGITREAALDAAAQNVRAMSGEGDAAIDAAIMAIETIVISARNNSLSQQNLKYILEQADQVVTLAGTFGYTILDRATRDLCDIVDGFLNSGVDHAAPVLVHIRAMRLFAPSSAPLGATASGQVLAELDKVRTHYNFPGLGPR